jgi:hypothetical protein
VAPRWTRFPAGICSASMRSTAHADVRETLVERRPLRKVFSKEQQAFFAECAPDGIRLDDLSVLGPIFVLKLKFTPESLQRRLVAEVWLYPDNTRILELPMKSAPRSPSSPPPRCEVSHGAACGPVRRAGDRDAKGARVRFQALRAGANRRRRWLRPSERRSVTGRGVAASMTLPTVGDLRAHCR